MGNLASGEVTPALIGVAGALIGVVIGVLSSHRLASHQARVIEGRSRAHEIRVLIAKVQGHTSLLSHRVRLGPDMARRKHHWAAQLLNPAEDLVPAVWQMFVEEARVDLAELGARLDLAGYLSPDALKKLGETFAVLEDAGNSKSEHSYVIGWAARYVAALDAIAAEVDARFDFDTRVQRGRRERVVGRPR